MQSCIVFVLSCFFCCDTAGGGTVGGRVLEFPDDVSVGRLVIVPEQYNFEDKHLKGKFLAECRGKVIVPPAAKLLLVSNDLITERYKFFDKFPVDAIDALILSRAIFSDDGMAHVGRLTGLRYLDAEGTEITDKGVAKLAGLVNLRFLNLSRTLMHGETLCKLGGLHKLVYLNLGCNELSKKAFVDLGKIDMPSLLQLDLSRSQIVDDDIPAAVKSKTIITLVLTDNRGITDRCLPMLKPITGLRGINARSTSITVKGLSGLVGQHVCKVALAADKKNTFEEMTIRRILPGLTVGFDKRSSSMPKNIFEPLH